MPKHYIRFGTHAEKKFFYGPYSEFYDGIFINGNMLAYTPNSIASFLLQINDNKRILIDPQTHAFQHSLDVIQNKKGDGIKSSLDSLATLYGEPIKTCLETPEPIKPEMFSDPNILKTFCENVGNFQINTVSNIIEGREEKKYIDFAKKEEAIKEIQAINDIVAPYFYIDAIGSEWVNVNIDLINKTKEIFTDKTVIGQIVINSPVLSDANLIQLIEKYKASNCDEYLIWIDGFSEDEQSCDNLKKLILFISQLAETGKPVTNLYGGYFSILLTKYTKGLSAISHGLEYGESRKVVPVGGGLPMAKYYFWPLHRRIKPDVFVTLSTKNNWEYTGVGSDFETTVCNCQSCKEIDKFFDSHPVKRSGRTFNYPTTQAKEHSLKHYLYCKTKEFNHVENTSSENLLSELQEAYDKYSTQLDNHEVNHLLNWKKAIEESPLLLS